MTTMTRNIGDLQENEKQLLAKLIGKALPQHVIQISISLVEQGDELDMQKQQSANGTIWDIFKNSTSGLSEDTLASLPEDTAERHDHYIYGTHDQ